MNKAISLRLRQLTILTFTCFMPFSFAASSYVIDSSNSIVSFATIKKQYAVEPGIFEKISGFISASGDIEIKVKLESVDTGVPIRDERLLELFFQSDKFPIAKITAKIDLTMLESISSQKRMDIPAKLELFGHEQDIHIMTLITKLQKGFIVTTLKPIIVSTSEYGIPLENLKKLAGTVEDIPISTVIPINAVLTFIKEGTSTE